MSMLSTYWKAPAILALLISLAACNRQAKTAAENKTAPQNASQTASVPGKTFDSPDAAGSALYNAARAEDQSALLAIFGPAGKEVLFTGDDAQDRTQMSDFAAAYAKMHRWGDIRAGGKTLYVGASNYPFPVPLGQTPSGRWYFDTAAGKDEILARRIGRNELNAIAASEAAAGAQSKFYQDYHAYASKFASDPGKHNGLYWTASGGEPASPMAQLGDFGKVVGANGGAPFNGYYYRMFSKPGGFVIVAYPARYHDSGIMTFMVSEDGTVYQKDLGDTTPETAAALSDYHPDNGWAPVRTESAGTASRQR